MRSNLRTVSGSSSQQYSEGLRKYMLSIYNYMSIGILISAVVALLVSSSPSLIKTIYGTPLRYIVMFAPLVSILVFSFKLKTMRPETAQLFFWSFCALMGLSLSYIFIIYKIGDVARAFFITSGMFGAMSLYGYTTKKDLTAMGSFLMMGVWGIVIASIVNLFMKSSGMSLIISYLAVAIFTGLTAYDTQKLKNLYFQLEGKTDQGTMKKVAIYGALQLYLDFINMFIHLLAILGRRE